MFITETIFFDLVVLVTTVLVLVVAYLKWKFTYWNKIGVPSLNPVIPFGDAKNLFLSHLTFGEQFCELYRKFKAQGHKHGGVFWGPKAFYIPVHPEMVKIILQTDFQHFVNHGFYINEEIDPLTGHLFNLEDLKWKNMRTKLTPTFTPNQIKNMFQTVMDCADNLKDVVEDSAKTGTPLDIKEVAARFTTDIIGSVGFGVESNSLKDPDAEFRKYGKKALDDWKNKLKLFMIFSLPRSLLNAVRYKFTTQEVEDFFMRIVKETTDYREKNNIYRKDFMHLLLQLKNRGSVTDDGKITEEDGKTGEKGLSMKEMAAQVYVFFMAGFETASTTMNFALYELATNQHIQEKLREEINRVLAKHNNNITYTAMAEMIYMEQVINETLRKYPPINFTTRQCSKDYIIPNTTVRLEKGVDIVIPILALHTDPEYYPDPEKFDPMRFTEEAKSLRPTFSYIPFGEGPRICIGLRLGILMIKVCLTTLLRDYRIQINGKTEIPLEFERHSFVMSTKKQIWLDVEKLT